MTIREATQFAAAYLAERKLRFPREDTELLLTSVLNRDRAFLLTHPEYELSAAEEEVYHQWLFKRGEHYPLQYLRGTQEFYGREFVLTPAVLIPRPETELLVEEGVRHLESFQEERLNILDVGAGSGCIAISLACEDRRSRVTATDITAAALDCARRNAERHGCLHRLEFLIGDALTPVLGRKSHYHLIVSNPPYVGLEDREHVDRSVAEYEPPHAVFAGATGLEIYEKLFYNGATILREEGRMMVELGYGSQDQVVRLAEDYGWQLEEVRKDLSSIDRCAIFRKS